MEAIQNVRLRDSIESKRGRDVDLPKHFISHREKNPLYFTRAIAHARRVIGMNEKMSR